MASSGLEDQVELTADVRWYQSEIHRLSLDSKKQERFFEIFGAVVAIALGVIFFFWDYHTNNGSTWSWYVTVGNFAVAVFFGVLASLFGLFLPAALIWYGIESIFRPDG